RHGFWTLEAAVPRPRDVLSCHYHAKSESGKISKSWTKEYELEGKSANVFERLSLLKPALGIRNRKCDGRGRQPC
ncbi:hypothetical protein GN958_ATG18368, partial [Phytophthora infestans]